MWTPFDRVAFFTDTVGAGSLAVGEAISNRFFTPDEAGVEDGTAELRYLLIQQSNVEIGSGTYSSGVLSRDAVEISKIDGDVGTDKISLESGVPASVRLIASAAVYQLILDGLGGGGASLGDVEKYWLAN